MIILETDRLLLRHWRDDDLEPFAAMNADEKVMEFYPAPYSRDQSDASATRFQKSLVENGFGLYAVEVKSTHDFIGYVGLAKVEFPAAFTPALEIGWRLAFHSWGQGYAAEAARATLSYGFSDLGVSELVSFTTRRNVRSIAVMERIGMVRNQEDDFVHPGLRAGHPQRPHVLYRATKPGVSKSIG